MRPEVPHSPLATPTDVAGSPHEPRSPINPTERIVVIDIVRGFALFGVLMLNLLSFSGPTLSFEAWAGSTTWWDKAVELVLFVGGEAAFYSTFSFLFGVGVALQIHRASSRNERFVFHHLSRMGVLLGFGLLHALLIWDGDILVNYSIAGSFLFLFSRLGPKALIWTAAGLGGVVALLMTIGGLVSAFGDTAPTTSADVAEDVETYGTGGFFELASDRFDDVGWLAVEGLLSSLWFIPIFLTGMWAIKTGKVANWREQQAFLIRVLRVSIPIAVAVKGIYAAMILTESTSMTSSLGPLLSTFIGGPALGATYVCLLLLFLQKRPDGGFFRHLAPVGRMALTNYLTQSVVAVTVFYGFGFGLYGQLGIALSVGLGIIFFGFQVVFSRWWLERFKFGPLEWLWRTLTYRRRPVSTSPTSTATAAQTTTIR